MANGWLCPIVEVGGDDDDLVCTIAILPTSVSGRDIIVE